MESIDAQYSDTGYECSLRRARLLLGGLSATFESYAMAKRIQESRHNKQDELNSFISEDAQGNIKSQFGSILISSLKLIRGDTITRVSNVAGCRSENV
jgi:hypothetical protein